MLCLKKAVFCKTEEKKTPVGGEWGKMSHFLFIDVLNIRENYAEVQWKYLKIFQDVYNRFKWSEYIYDEGL